MLNPIRIHTRHGGHKPTEFSADNEKCSGLCPPYNKLRKVSDKSRGQQTTPLSVQQRWKKLARTLEQAATLNSYADIKDPATWQRTQHQQ